MIIMLLSTLDYASYLSYTPRGTTEEAKKSQQIRDFIKQESIVSRGDIKNIPMSELIARRIKDEFEKLSFKDFFGDDVFLVPVPKSSLMVTGALWVPHRLVQALCKFNLGKEFNCLTRIKSVKKAAFARPVDRPKPIEHYQTISVQKILGTPKKILLVDDVVTKGATLLGSASRLHEAFPESQIRAFAALRTISEPINFKSINSPITGKITLTEAGDAHRDP